MQQWLRSLLFVSFVIGTTTAQAADAVVKSPLNIRKGPGTRYSVHTVLPAGYRVNIRTCRQNWCQISYGNYTGWASTRYLAFKTGNPGAGQDTRNPHRAVAPVYGRNHMPPHQQMVPDDPKRRRSFYHRRDYAPRWWNNYHQRNPDYRPDWRPRWWKRR